MIYPCREPSSYLTPSGIVGVGGLMMQGGLSFLSAQYGMAADVCDLRVRGDLG